MTNLFLSATLTCAMTVTATFATAETWDVSLPWGPSEYHVGNAERFAEAVEEATGGELSLKIHAGGALGVRPTETVRALEDGIVPMGETAAMMNVGDLPLLGLDGIPFLFDDESDVERYYQLIRPVWEEALETRNQKLLYSVPWPTQLIFTNRKIESLDDFEGLAVRTMDTNTSNLAESLGMLPLIMGSADVIPALATGKLDAVMTSGTTAVAQQLWEFLDYGYVTNHMVSFNLMSVNMDYWNELAPETQQTVLDLAATMEPEFWEVARQEHDMRMKQLEENGLEVSVPSPDMLAAMRDATASLEQNLVASTGADAERVLNAYHAED
ncbi:TRAP transporter substrate-binding protein [Celeribacter indicus]|nr:TRAP transporter substrate-binding protein [Celeribacter indicus]SDW09937.1 TRAP-type C4-dicarboxylate transport system, substrate-binding protein [Celeribacter indicus]